MKLLTFSTLFPNTVTPSHGIFVETRLRHLVKSGAVEARVVAPVPWFPSSHPRFGEYARFARVPRVEERHGIPVLHPRYPLLPKVGMTIAPALLYAATKPVLARLIDEGYDFDLIDAHYCYPDGVAAAMLARHFGKPLSITARGTDISLIPEYALPRRMIMWATRRAGALITVCQALKDEMVKLGVPAERVTPLRNGVDLELFRPVDRATERTALGMRRFTLLSVGLLISRKAHDLVIEALPALPDTDLVIAGNGPERDSLNDLAARLGVAERVRFVGALPQSELRRYYGAADALVLASSREGWANVLLEAMACGTPVVASRVWGTPEVVAAPEAGVLMPERTAAGVAAGVRELRDRYPERSATRRYAERFNWDDTTAGQLELFRSMLANAAAAKRCPA